MEVIEITEFIRPNGRQRKAIANINKEDKEFIENNEIKVSVETDRSGTIILYFDYGKEVDGEPDEYIHLVFDKNEQTEETFSKVIPELKKLI